MVDLHSLYNELRVNLFRCSIFYISKSIKDTLDEMPEASLPLLGKILTLDSDYKFSIYDESFSIMKKCSVLEENAFKLVQYRTQLNPDEFNYFAENYINYVELLKNFSSKLLTEFEIDFPKGTKSLKTNFSVQHQFFLNHLQEIEKLTGIKSQASQWEDIVAEYSNGRKLRKPIRRILTEKIIIATDSKFDYNENDEVEIVKKNLKDYINHKSNTEIAEIIILKFRNRQPKVIRNLIECLKEQKLITIISKEFKEFLIVLNESFKNEKELKYKSIAGIQPDSKDSKAYRDIKSQLLLSISEFYL